MDKRIKIIEFLVRQLLNLQGRLLRFSGDTPPIADHQHSIEMNEFYMEHPVGGKNKTFLPMGVWVGRLPPDSLKKWQEIQARHFKYLAEEWSKRYTN